MKVFVDGDNVEIFSGAIISDILRLYSEEVYENVLSGKKKVFDEYDNNISLDGAASPGSKYFIREK